MAPAIQIRKSRPDAAWRSSWPPSPKPGQNRGTSVRTRTYLTDPGDWEAVGRAHGAVFAEIRPASTMLAVAALLDPRWKVEIEAEAMLDES